MSSLLYKKRNLLHYLLILPIKSILFVEIVQHNAHLCIKKGA